MDLPVGQTTVTFRVRALDAGFHIYRVVVEAGQDTFSQNNRADSDTIVKGEPRILVVAGDPAIGSQLVDALRVEHQQVDTALPEAMPADLAGLANYDSIVLVDVPRARLTATQMLALQTYVRDIGRGLVMVGGPDSYGAGGYTKTPLEESLPVDMGVRDRQKEPDIALVVVIDESGSMDACHCNTFNQGGGSPDRRGPQGRHRQGGDPARGVGDAAQRPAGSRRPSTRRPTGRSTRRRWAPRATSRARSPGSSPTARRTSSPASTRR